MNSASNTMPAAWGSSAMGSAGSDGPTVAFRIVIEHDGDPPSVDDVVAAMQECKGACYIEVHPAKGTPCEEVGHLLGEECLRCKNMDGA